ncbi:Gene 25-like lysozyme (plasmid) [Streptomyces sp. YIM 121038]|nr:Gene 25-like lysozyme [Streptomyces sp. YIM 121038]
MRPEFGCAIHNLVFAPVNATTAGLMEQAVHEALERWEPRVEVDSVTVQGDEANTARVYISIWYHARNSNDPRNLVFPFYTIPAHAPEIP